MIVEATAYVYPTEEEEKVRKAILNILPSSRFEEYKRTGEVTVLKAITKGIDSLENFREMLRRQLIRDSARTVLNNCVSDTEIIFHLNKQVAYAKKISFCRERSESPLGPITVRIRCSDPYGLVQKLTAKQHYTA